MRDEIVRTAVLAAQKVVAQKIDTAGSRAVVERVLEEVQKK